MNKEKINFWMEQKEFKEKKIEELLRERPLNMGKIREVIMLLSWDIFTIERDSSGKATRIPCEIEKDLLEKYHLPPKEMPVILSEADKKRIQLYEKTLEDISQKKPLHLTRILNLINIIGHYRATNENDFQKIKQELCEKYNIPYTRHEYNQPFFRLNSQPPQETHYFYSDNTAVRTVGVPTLFEILAGLLGL